MTCGTPLHVVFVISTLGRGGSERQMINLAAELNRRGHRAEIAVLTDEGPMSDQATSAGVPVIKMSRTGRRLSALIGLVRYVRQTKPQIVHPYLPRDNALVSLIKPLIKNAILVWGVRSSDVDWVAYKRRTRLFASLVTRVSRSADLVIANSHFGAGHHLDQGYSQKTMLVIPNGIDTATFVPDPQIHHSRRSPTASHEEVAVVGMLGRFDPMKGHDQILDVFAQARQHRADLHLAVVGLHSPQQEHRFLEEVSQRDLDGHVTLEAETSSPADMLNTFDVLVLPSKSEAFPNVVAESLSCGVPIVAFDVGDVKRIVGEFGSVVPRGDNLALARAIVEVLDQKYDRAEMHAHIEQHYSIAALTDRSLDAFRQVIFERQGK